MFDSFVVKWDEELKVAYDEDMDERIAFDNTQEVEYEKLKKKLMKVPPVLFRHSSEYNAARKIEQEMTRQRMFNKAHQQKMMAE